MKKKILLGLGTMTITAMPVVAMVSCSDENDNHTVTSSFEKGTESIKASVNEYTPVDVALNMGIKPYQYEIKDGVIQNSLFSFWDKNHYENFDRSFFQRVENLIDNVASQIEANQEAKTLTITINPDGGKPFKKLIDFTGPEFQKIVYDAMFGFGIPETIDNTGYYCAQYDATRNYLSFAPQSIVEHSDPLEFHSTGSSSVSYNKESTYELGFYNAQSVGEIKKSIDKWQPKIWEWFDNAIETVEDELVEIQNTEINPELIETGYREDQVFEYYSQEHKDYNIFRKNLEIETIKKYKELTSSQMLAAIAVFDAYDEYFTENFETSKLKPNSVDFNKVSNYDDLDTSSIVQIGAYVFSDAVLPEDFSMPSKVTKIDYGAFSGSVLPEDFNLNDQTELIGENAFSNAVLPTDFTLPRTLTSIPQNSFTGAEMRDDSSINDWYTYWMIHNHLNDEAGNIERNKPHIPTSLNGYTYIPSGSFAGEVLPASFEIPKSVTSIGSGAFSNVKFNVSDNAIVNLDWYTYWMLKQSGLTMSNYSSNGVEMVVNKDGAHVQIHKPDTPSSLIGYKYIPASSYQNFTFTEDFVIPHSVTKIGTGAFSNSRNNFDVIDDWYTYWMVRQNSNIGYSYNIQQTNHKPDFAVDLRNLEYIPNYSLSYVDLPQGFEIPSSVKEIGDGAFYQARLNGQQITEGTDLGNGWVATTNGNVIRKQN